MKYLFGVHPTEEAFKNSPSSIHKIFLKKGLNKKVLDNFINLAKKHKVTYSIVSERDLVKMIPDNQNANHQGVVMIQNEIQMQELDSFLLKNKNDGVVILMHELSDPHNVGAIIRSAGAFDAMAVIIPSRNQAPITDVVVKVSAGAIYTVPIIKIININTAILKLKEAGFWIYGLTEKGSDSIYKTDFDKRSVIVVGNEHSGIDQAALKKCDFKIQIPIDDKIDSLNASVSASIALYEWKRSIK